MARTVDEVSAPYANFMLNPAPAGSGICSVCWRFASPSYPTCYECGRVVPPIADVVVPITYSIEREQMHHSLRLYKDGATERIRDRFTMELAAVLWRFLRDHERCIAARIRVRSFDMVTVVPSGTRARDEARDGLRRIVGELVRPTAERYERLLAPTDSAAPKHQYDPNRFVARRRLNGQDVLLVDDTWTKGPSVQSAALVLKNAGAGRVGVLVIGRHVDPYFKHNGARLRELPRPFRWDVCAVHGD
jgi:predicted amidophosphoribosyltransferase